MLSTIIEKLNASYPNQEECSFSIKEISYEHVTKTIVMGESSTGTYRFVCYKIRVLFEGKELPVLAKYQESLIKYFIDGMAINEGVNVDKDYNGNVYLPSHDGGKYKISCNLTIIA